MISRTTRIQLFVFALITLLGISYVGAKYAQLDRLFTDETYTVSADLPDSGGIYVGAEVTYRGVSVGPGREPPAARRWGVRRPGDPAQRRHDPLRRGRRGREPLGDR